jgi:cytochrome b
VRAPDAAATPVRVWAVPVRLAHWGLAACVLGCLALYEGGRWHEWLGYGALVISVLRLAAGWVGSPPDSPARFRRFVLGPVATWHYARSVMAGREPRHLGHNPLGGWMVLALLWMALMAAASGALYVTDRYWGDEAVWWWHAVASWSLLGLVPLHLAGVVLTSIRHRENLVRAMLDGRKRPPAPGDLPP